MEDITSLFGDPDDVSGLSLDEQVAVHIDHGGSEELRRLAEGMMKFEIVASRNLDVDLKVVNRVDLGDDAYDCFTNINADALSEQLDRHIKVTGLIPLRLTGDGDVSTGSFKAAWYSRFLIEIDPDSTVSYYYSLSWYYAEPESKSKHDYAQAFGSKIVEMLLHAHARKRQSQWLRVCVQEAPEMGARQQLV